MAKYYMDTEFNEDFNKPLFGNKRHFIDLISIGIVCEDNRMYYSVSKDFDLKSAWNKFDLKASEKPLFQNPEKNKVYWIRDNVLKSIFRDLIKEEKKRTDIMSRLTWYSVSEEFTYSNLKQLIKKYGKTNKQIANEIVAFINPDLGFHYSGYNNSEFRNKESYISKHFDFHNVKEFDGYFFAQPEFFAYFCSHDWVVFCSLFGTMMNRPTGFPMYCNDLKQTSDEANNRCLLLGDSFEKGEITREQYPRQCWHTELKYAPNYPINKDEHNALSDAKWNKELHCFLENIK